MRAGRKMTIAVVGLLLGVGVGQADPPLPVPVRELPPLPVPSREDELPRDPLTRPLTPPPPDGEVVTEAPVIPVSATPDPALGFAGPSRVRSRSGSNDEYDTVEDRWRIGLPPWDRSDKGHPPGFDYPFAAGRWFDPYTQHVLKGDYPVLGQNTFLNLSGSATWLFEGRSIPTAASPPLPPTPKPVQSDFFARSGQFAHAELYAFSFDLFHGDAAFKPADWRVRLTPAVGVNSLNAQQVRVVSPYPAKGTSLTLGWVALQEWFGEYKLAEWDDQYDFLSVRAGAQPFTSDFRGFVYSDVNRGVRLFGNADGNRTQYNLVYMRQLDKDSATQLNTLNDRDQNVVIANVYRQDFLVPGYFASASFHYNNDGPDVTFARNGALVRPDPVGARQPHRVEAYYLGFAGDGHIDQLSLSHACYWVLGRDSFNPLANRAQTVSAQMAALELSYTRDWVRFRSSGFWASGDGNAGDGRATGFDSILDNTNFAGPFSFWRRQRIPLFGVGLPNDQSLYPDLRASRGQGQSNFVNPGLWLVNLGVDFDITPKVRLVNNANYLWFDKTNPLEVLTALPRVRRDIGLDLSTGVEYRPVLNNNLIVTGGLSALIPGTGFQQIYNPPSATGRVLLSGFVELTLAF